MVVKFTNGSQINVKFIGLYGASSQIRKTKDNSNISNIKKAEQCETLKDEAAKELSQLELNAKLHLVDLQNFYQREIKDLQASFEIDINSIISILQKAKEF